MSFKTECNEIVVGFWSSFTNDLINKFIYGFMFSIHFFPNIKICFRSKLRKKQGRERLQSANLIIHKTKQFYDDLLSEINHQK